MASFCTPSELLRKLEQRFNLPVPPNMIPAEIALFKEKKLDRIQIRVCSVLKNWIEEHWSDFSGSPQLKKKLHSLIKKMLGSSSSPLSLQLARALKMLIAKKEKWGLNGPTYIRIQNNPKVLYSGLGGDSLLSDCHPLELARQLTLMDFEKFRQITPRECLNQGWSKKGKNKCAPNIVFMIEQFERISGWVQSEILKYADANKRAGAYKKFIMIAKHCQELNNFNSLFAIYCALSANAIYRLKHTKELLNSKHVAIYEKLQELFKGDRNSKNFRTALRRALTPCIPHLGLYLQDLTFTEDGNPDTIKDLINWNKRCKLAERIRWIKQYQMQRYMFTRIPQIQEYLGKALRIVDEETLWRKSLEVEPREPTQ